MSERFAEILLIWDQLPVLGATTIWVMVGMTLFATFLAKVILQTTVNGLPMLCAGMLAGCYISIHVLRYMDVLGFGRMELMDASIASMIGIGASILPTVLMMRLLSWEN